MKLGRWQELSSHLMDPASTFQHLKEYQNKITYLHTILLWEMLWRSKQIIITINSSVALVKMLPDCKKWAYHNILPALRRKQQSGRKVIQTSESKAAPGSKVISLIEMFLYRWSVNFSNMILQTGKGTSKNKGEVGERKKDQWTRCSVFNQYLQS